MSGEGGFKEEQFIDSLLGQEQVRWQMLSSEPLEIVLPLL
jgi:hypothetical protein